MLTYSRVYALTAALLIRFDPFWVVSQQLPSDMPSGNGGAIDECTGPTACNDDSCGNCKNLRGVPGCSCSGCECVVCEQDPFCCAKEWDHICVKRAENLCDCEVFPTTTPIASPTSSPAPTVMKYPSNMYFTVTGPYTASNTTGIYAANTEGLGGPQSLLYSLVNRGLNGITATSCDLRRLYWGTEDGAIMYGSIDGAAGLPTTLYQYVDGGIYGIGSIYGIAVNEELGVILLGTYNGLFMVGLDGQSNRAVMLDGPDINYSYESSLVSPAVALDTSSGYVYYGGRKYSEENKGFIKLLLPPYETESPRVLYTTDFFDINDYEGYPQDIAIDVSRNTLFFVEKSNVYSALLDGTSLKPVILYREELFNNETVQTVEYDSDELYIGVYDYNGTSKIYKAKADGSSIPTVLYNVPLGTMDYYTGIRGVTVVSCPSPTESPTPCSTDSKTSLVFPLSTTLIPVGNSTSTSNTIPAFVVHTGWKTDKIASITIDIEKKRTNGTWQNLEGGLEFDIASGVAGTYVLLHNVAESGMFRWKATAEITDDACQTQDATDWEQFSLS